MASTTNMDPAQPPVSNDRKARRVQKLHAKYAELPYVQRIGRIQRTIQIDNERKAIARSNSKVRRRALQRRLDRQREVAPAIRRVSSAPLASQLSARLSAQYLDDLVAPSTSSMSARPAIAGKGANEEGTTGHTAMNSAGDNGSDPQETSCKYHSRAASQPVEQTYHVVCDLGRHEQLQMHDAEAREGPSAAIANTPVDKNLNGADAICRTLSVSDSGVDNGPEKQSQQQPTAERPACDVGTGYETDESSYYAEPLPKKQPVGHPACGVGTGYETDESSYYAEPQSKNQSLAMVRPVPVRPSVPQSKKHSLAMVRPVSVQLSVPRTVNEPLRSGSVGSDYSGPTDDVDPDDACAVSRLHRSMVKKQTDILSESCYKMQMAREEYEEAISELPIGSQRSRMYRSPWPAPSGTVAKDQDELCTSDEELMMDALGPYYWPHDSPGPEDTEDASMSTEVPETRGSTPMGTSMNHHGPGRNPVSTQTAHVHDHTSVPVPTSFVSSLVPSSPYRVLPGPDWPMDVDALDVDTIKANRAHLLSVFGSAGLPCLLSGPQHRGSGVIVFATAGKYSVNKDEETYDELVNSHMPGTNSHGFLKLIHTPSQRKGSQEWTAVVVDVMDGRVLGAVESFDFFAAHGTSRHHPCPVNRHASRYSFVSAAAANGSDSPFMGCIRSILSYGHIIEVKLTWLSMMFNDNNGRYSWRGSFQWTALLCPSELQNNAGCHGQ
ncbi:hypothetical protein BJ508DRAFT_308163 [Ascobolus immersus RN42]|uniref:Uncharacterized protein n=1 Tax=Ascobolus immersus RN42 TaxID=1160509 RepID=A0A3N4I0P7_ASCIM|nr:hypothetical protein BJ508DRAFT_308163 [Ascobolus immersus RN42]